MPTWGGGETMFMVDFSSLFKQHTCADHKKRLVRVQPGKPQQQVHLNKLTGIKGRKPHRFNCAFMSVHPQQLPDYFPIHPHPVISSWLKRRKWNSSCLVTLRGFHPTRVHSSSPLLRVSREALVRSSAGRSECFVLIFFKNNSVTILSFIIDTLPNP